MNFGPQVDIPVGLGEASNVNQNQAWQGLTIKEILEKVDLSNIIMDEDKKKVRIYCQFCSHFNFPICFDGFLYTYQRYFRPHMNLFQDKFENPTMSNGMINPESAFLGPKLWSKPIPMPVTGENDDFSVMNIDDFLSENGFDLEEPSSPTSQGELLTHTYS